MRFPSLIVAFTMGAGSVAASGTCPGPGELSVGQTVEMASSDAWYSGTLVAVSMLNPARPYLVRDENGSEAWFPSAEVRAASAEVGTDALGTADGTFGDWDLTADSVVSDTAGEMKGLQPEQGELRIQPDGTFAWTAGTERIEGRWDAAKSATGSVVLHAGAAGLDWSARFDGRDAEGLPRLRLMASDGRILLGQGDC